MTGSTHACVRSTAIAIFAALLTRALIPLGYMPGDVGTGRFVELCPTQSAATYRFLRLDHHNHHGAPDNGAWGAAGDTCPLGAASQWDAITAGGDPGDPARDPARVDPTTAAAPLSLRPIAGFRARAPPREQDEAA